MANIIDLNDQNIIDIIASKDTKKVGIICALDETGSIKLCNRWSEEFLEQGYDVIRLPVGSEFADEVLPHLDGLLMPGGDSNIHPQSYEDRYQRPLYGDDTFDQERDAFSFDLFKKAYDMDMPVLGICRGMQEMIVASGGALRRLPTDMVDHTLGYKTRFKEDGSLCLKGLDTRAHHISISNNSDLLEMFNGTNVLYVNSVHKEGITRDMWDAQEMRPLRDTFSIQAMAPDGVVEAIQAKDKSCIWGFQAHFEIAGPMHDVVYSNFFNHIDVYHERHRPKNAKNDSQHNGDQPDMVVA